MKTLKAFLMTFVLMVLVLPPVSGADAPRGRVTGGQQYELPGWFKNSFLVLNEDVEAARQRGRHVMLFMHLDECPYCARLLEENFRSGETREFTEKHFDVEDASIGELRLRCSNNCIIIQPLHLELETAK